jgi:hypothetical protein
MNESSNGPQISDADADRMVTMRKAGLTLDEIARVYGITAGGVYAVLRKRIPADELGASGTGEPTGEAHAAGTPVSEPPQAAEPAPAGVPQYAPIPAPARPRRKRRRILVVGFAAAVVIGAVIGVGVGLSGTGTKNTAAGSNLPDVNTGTPVSQVTDPDGGVCAQLQANGYCPGDAPSPTTPPPSTPTTVTFSVTGTGNGGGAQITYGNNEDDISPSQCTGGDLGESCTVPWSATLPFDGTAEYWDIDAQLGSEGGSITCTITVSGPGDQPLTVATGQASGAYQICDAQAAPTNSSGLSWQQE